MHNPFVGRDADNGRCTSVALEMSLSEQASSGQNHTRSVFLPLHKAPQVKGAYVACVARSIASLMVLQLAFTQLLATERDIPNVENPEEVP